MINVVQHVKDAGFQYFDDVIHLFVGGSALHGAKVEGTDDVDIYGVYIEPPEKVIGLDKCEHFVWSTATSARRNTADDVDVTLYSLRKFAGLACKGNPTALHFLYAPNGASSPQFWNEVSPEIKECVLSKQAVNQFLGFVDAQMGRLLGTRGRGKKGQRPELEAQYGYDVKAGMHAVRLLHECVEMLSTGEITLPRPERDLLIKVRTGGWTLGRLEASVNHLVELVHRAEAASPLPDKPDRERLSRLIADTYQRYWAKEKVQRAHRSAMREVREKQQAAIKKQQDDCNHLAGGLGPGPSNMMTCIVWHIFEDDPEHAVGICMHCGRQWRYTDPDYQEWRMRRSINRLSTGGLKAQSSALPHMAGTPIFVSEARTVQEERPLEEEPPINLTLREFVISERLKQKSEAAARVICKDLDVYNMLREALI